MKKLGVNMCINWGLIWEVGVGEGLGMRDIAKIGLFTYIIFISNMSKYLIITSPYYSSRVLNDLRIFLGNFVI